MGINEINVELSENVQRYVNECCESESDGKIDSFDAGCCKCRGGVAVAVWCDTGVARRLGRRNEAGERGAMGRGKDGPEM
jgi:hypothetical protein